MQTVFFLSYPRHIMHYQMRKRLYHTFHYRMYWHNINSFITIFSFKVSIYSGQCNVVSVGRDNTT